MLPPTAAIATGAPSAPVSDRRRPHRPRLGAGCPRRRTTSGGAARCRRSSLSAAERRNPSIGVKNVTDQGCTQQELHLVARKPGTQLRNLVLGQEVPLLNLHPVRCKPAATARADCSKRHGERPNRGSHQSHGQGGRSQRHVKGMVTAGTGNKCKVSVPSIIAERLSSPRPACQTRRI